MLILHLLTYLIPIHQLKKYVEDSIKLLKMEKLFIGEHQIGMHHKFKVQ